ncbi:DUF4238 domain-containing protein [Corallococcus silvisoli]|uniref:DUF4238 domain-containing protein n=1 Tax=Corallococcus silvisoli TaxID=2697031 RepID=UPI001378C424|nr:DUF4238 domain-containing protein [Corallococcus silvisoli]NBD13820.1 DUF4238 domain-containing protein [Corallococcus silvisoli]
MNQHFVPRVYLRQWCNDDGFLIRYRRVGPPNALRLRPEREVPDGICWEKDLYSLPSNSMANGLSGVGVERLLSTKIEQVLAGIVESVATRSGRLDTGLGDQVRWLMQTFIARSPRTMAALETRVVDFVQENDAEISRLQKRAQTAGVKGEIDQYRDERMPAVMARATLAAIADNQFLPSAGWVDGIVHVISYAEVSRFLDVLGLDGFPTFEEPVIEWDGEGAGLVATLALSPDQLALVVKGEGACGWEMALRHMAGALRFRRSAICRREAVGALWVSQAEQLMPWR